MSKEQNLEVSKPSEEESCGASKNQGGQVEGEKQKENNNGEESY